MDSVAVNVVVTGADWLGPSHQPVAAEEPVAEERGDGLVERVLTVEDLAGMIDAELPERATVSPWLTVPADEVRVARGRGNIYAFHPSHGCVAGYCIQPDEGLISLETGKHYTAIRTLAIKALLDLDENAFLKIANDESETTETRLTRARRRQRSR